MKQNEIAFIDVKLHEDEIEWGIRDIKRFCDENSLVKMPYMLRVRNFFSEYIENTAEEIYNKIVLEKEDKNYKFSESDVNSLINNIIEKLIDKYIRSISDNMGGMYLKYNLDEKEIASFRSDAKVKCDEQSKMMSVRYRNSRKTEQNEFQTRLFSAIAAGTGLILMLFPLFRAIFKSVLRFLN